MQINGFTNYNIDEDGVVINVKTSRVLKPEIIWDGYERVTLSQDGLLKRFRVHRLVAEHFISNPNVYPMVNHKDGDKRNNSLGNLEWVTCQQNTIHAFDNNLRASGIEHYEAKLTEEEVHEACKLIELGLTRMRILNKIQNMKKTQFDDIRRRRSWKRISKGYSW